MRAILFLLVLISAAPGRADLPSPRWIQGFDRYVEQARREWQAPGVGIAIVRADQVLLARGFGVKELGKDEPVDADTLFGIGSNTKAFTATAVGLLVADGTIAWEDHVVDLLRGFQLYDPYATRELTVRDLLCHRGGYQTWAGDLVAWGSIYDRDAVLRRIRYLKPDYSFRSRYGYCNWAFVAAGQIIPQVSDGASWEQFVAMRILRPLGMKRTTMTIPDLAADKNVATPHAKFDGKWTTTPHRHLENYGPAGSICSSAHDMANWLRMQLGEGKFDGKQVVPAAIIRETRTPQMVVPMSEETKRLYPSQHFQAYGLGFMLKDHRGRLVVTHNGAVDGMFSSVGFLPEENIGVVVLTNSETSLSTALMWAALDRAMGVTGKDATDWSKVVLEKDKADQAKEEEVMRKELALRSPGQKTSLELQAYAGRYHHDLLGDATVEQVQGGLRLRLASHVGLNAPLEHWHHDVFRAAWADRYMKTSMVTFSLDETGKVREFKLKFLPFVDPLEYVFTVQKRP